MAFKTFEVPELGTVTVYKRRGSRSLRLSVQPDGNLRVTIPVWAPYASGLTFARSRTAWIQQHVPSTRNEMTHGQIIGKSHRLLFTTDLAANKINSRVSAGTISIKLPPGVSSTAQSAQTAAQAAATKALRRQAEDLLPDRLAALAAAHGFTYRSVGIRQLKSRWGSCDQHANITLNLYLMTLPWELIDYVLLHELVHTRIMQHGPIFWQALGQIEPNLSLRRTAIKAHRPIF